MSARRLTAAAVVMIAACVPAAVDNKLQQSEDRRGVDQCAAFCAPHSFTYSYMPNRFHGPWCHCQGRSECPR